jgi:hypothetical protein
MGDVEEGRGWGPSQYAVVVVMVIIRRRSTLDQIGNRVEIVDRQDTNVT